MRVERPVLVGVDGGEDAAAAVRWAVEEARLRCRPLRLVHAYQWLPPYGSLPPHPSVLDPDAAGVRRAAEAVVAGAVRRAAGLAPDLDVQGVAVEGPPVPVLLAEAELAELVVLASRRLHAVGYVVLGSVGTGLAGHAPCPLVVVRCPAGLPDEGARVVAGVDGTAGSEAVLGYAFDHAARHGASLAAVLCWQPHLGSVARWRSGAAADARVQARAWLSEALAGWREKYPEVAVTAQVIDDHPVRGLVAESDGQHLLVVGAHPRRAMAVLPGSVSHGVLHRATCPVAVVPTED